MSIIFDLKETEAKIFKMWLVHELLYFALINLESCNRTV